MFRLIPLNRHFMLRHLREIHKVLVVYLRDPIAAMRVPISLSWPALFSLQIGAAMLSGAILGLLNRSFCHFVFS